jgi:hypothetical protein
MSVFWKFAQRHDGSSNCRAHFGLHSPSCGRLPLTTGSGVLTGHSDTVMVMPWLPGLTPPPESSLPEPPYLALPMVTHIVILTLTQYVYRVTPQTHITATPRRLVRFFTITRTSSAFPPVRNTKPRPLFFDIGNGTCRLDANTQILPRALNALTQVVFGIGVAALNS